MDHDVTMDPEYIQLWLQLTLSGLFKKKKIFSISFSVFFRDKVSRSNLYY